LVRKCILRLLSESVLGDSLEGLLYVDGLLGGRLEVGHLVLGVTPLLSSLRAHGPVVEVHFVSEDHKGKIVGVSGAGLYEKLVPPRVERLEGVWGRDVISEDAAVGAAVKCHSKGLETLLASRVPDLHCHKAVVNHHLFGEKIGSNGSLVLVRELLVNILVHQGGLPHPAVPQNDHLEKNLLPTGHDCLS